MLRLKSLQSAIGLVWNHLHVRTVSFWKKSRQNKSDQTGSIQPMYRNTKLHSKSDVVPFICGAFTVSLEWLANTAVRQLYFKNKKTVLLSSIIWCWSQKTLPHITSQFCLMNICSALLAFPVYHTNRTIAFIGHALEDNITCCICILLTFKLF